MAVVQATIKTSLLDLYNSMKTSAMSEEDFADAMATIIRDTILTADVSFSIGSGIAVSVDTGTGIGSTTEGSGIAVAVDTGTGVGSTTGTSSGTGSLT